MTDNTNRIKILVWNRTGLVLVHKRLEGCKFVWPTIADGVMRLRLLAHGPTTCLIIQT